MRRIVRGGETFSWDREADEHDARSWWMIEPPGHTFVAVDDHGTVVGTSEIGPNHGGGGAHVTTAGFMVDPDYAGQGAGRALGSTCSSRRVPTATARSSSMQSSRPTRGRVAPNTFRPGPAAGERTGDVC